MLYHSTSDLAVEAKGKVPYLVGTKLILGLILLSVQLPQQQSSLVHLVIRTVTWY